MAGLGDITYRTGANIKSKYSRAELAQINKQKYPRSLFKRKVVIERVKSKAELAEEKRLAELYSKRRHKLKTTYYLFSNDC